jgi:sodium/hydrogen antiporter
MEDIYKLLLVSSTFVMLFGLVSKHIRKQFLVPESLVSMTVGIVLGHSVLGLFRTNYAYSKILMYNFSRLVLCIQTMSVAMSLPGDYVMGKWQSLAVLVLVVGIMECAFSFVLIYIFSRYNAAISWSLAACLTPTDPILSSSIMQGDFAVRKVPERIRILLSAESGINDGLGILLLFIGFDLLGKTPEHGVYDFLANTLLRRVFFSAASGVLLGLFSRKALKYCYIRRLMGIESFMVHGLVLTMFSLGAMELLGGCELICIFFAVTAFSSDEWVALETKSSNIQGITDTVLSSSLFLLFGSRIYFSRFTYPMVLASLLIIFIRRPLICRLMSRHIPELRNTREALFVGWFGPIGVGALYYSLLTDKLQETLTIDFVSCTVFFSILIHGLTVPFYYLLNRVWPGLLDDVEAEETL